MIANHFKNNKVATILNNDLNTYKFKLNNSVTDNIRTDNSKIIDNLNKDNKLVNNRNKNNNNNRRFEFIIEIE